MLNGDLHYDADENWYFLGEGFMPQDDDLIKEQLIEYYPNINYQEEAVVELFATTVHEIGHSLGLDHNKKDSIMNYYYLNTWDSSTNVLPEQDRYDIYMKYGSGRITFNSVWFLIVGAVLIVVLSVVMLVVSVPLKTYLGSLSPQKATARVLNLCRHATDAFTVTGGKSVRVAASAEQSRCVRRLAACARSAH